MAEQLEILEVYKVDFNCHITELRRKTVYKLGENKTKTGYIWVSTADTGAVYSIAKNNLIHKKTLRYLFQVVSLIDYKNIRMDGQYCVFDVTDTTYTLFSDRNNLEEYPKEYFIESEQIKRYTAGDLDIKANALKAKLAKLEEEKRQNLERLKEERKEKEKKKPSKHKKKQN